jgi:transposase-like protein
VAEAKAVIRRLELSRLSVAQFASRENLDAQRLYLWRRKLRAGRRTTPGFIEFKPTPAVAVEVVLRSGHVLRVPGGFDEEAVRRLVVLLEGPVLAC